MSEPHFPVVTVTELGESWWTGDEWAFVPRLRLYSPAPGAGVRFEPIDGPIPPENPG